MFVWCFRFTFASFTCLKISLERESFIVTHLFGGHAEFFSFLYISVLLIYCVGMIARFPFVRHTTCIAINLRYYMGIVLYIYIYNIHVYLLHTCIANVR